MNKGDEYRNITGLYRQMRNLLYEELTLMKRKKKLVESIREALGLDEKEVLLKTGNGEFLITLPNIFKQNFIHKGVKTYDNKNKIG